MDKMTVKMPVAIKAKVTEAVKAKIIAQLQDDLKGINLEIEQFEFSAKRVINEHANSEEGIPEGLTEHIAMEREKRTQAKEDIETQLRKAEKLELGAEIGHGQLERDVTLEIGTDLDALLGAEIVVEDGKIIAFRD